MIIISLSTIMFHLPLCFLFLQTATASSSCAASWLLQNAYRSKTANGRKESRPEKQYGDVPRAKYTGYDVFLFSVLDKRVWIGWEAVGGFIE